MMTVILLVIPSHYTPAVTDDVSLPIVWCYSELCLPLYAVPVGVGLYDCTLQVY